MSTHRPTDSLFLKPASADLIVRDPVSTLPLAADGEFKPRTKYWHTRLRDGDVVTATPPKKTRGQPLAKPQADTGDN